MAAIVVVAAALVLAGVVPLSTVIYAGMFGGMILMHVGGHGHGGHKVADESRETPTSEGPEAEAGLTPQGDRPNRGCH